MQVRVGLVSALSLPLLFVCPGTAQQTPSDQANTIAQAHFALQSGDLGNAVRLHSDYLTRNPSAADAAKETLHLAWIMYKQGLPDTTMQAAFSRVVSRYPGTAEAARARMALANYSTKQTRFDSAIGQFQEVADDSTTPTEIADEALLETGFLSIQQHFAERVTPGSGEASVLPDEAAKLAFLEQARERLQAVVKILEARAGDPYTHQTAAAYAACGVGEIWLLEGCPEIAETWYQSALDRGTGVVHPAVRTLATLGLGVCLYREGRYVTADLAFRAVTEKPVTGIVLYSLNVSDRVVGQAYLWRAAVARHLNDTQTMRNSVALGVSAFKGKDSFPGDQASWLLATRWQTTLDAEAERVTGRRSIIAYATPPKNSIASIEGQATQASGSSVKAVSGPPTEPAGLVFTTAYLNGATSETGGRK